MCRNAGSHEVDSLTWRAPHFPPSSPVDYLAGPPDKGSWLDVNPRSLVRRAGPVETSDSLPELPFSQMQRNPARMRSSSTDWQIERSTPPRRSIWFGVSRMPGISRNSARILRTPVGREVHWISCRPQAGKMQTLSRGSVCILTSQVSGGAAVEDSTVEPVADGRAGSANSSIRFIGRRRSVFFIGYPNCSGVRIV
jgi:hypothetical protein